MNQDNSTIDLLDDQQIPQMSSGLKTLTVLTFIGCAVFGLLTLCLPMIYKFFLEMIDKAQSSGKDLSAKEIADMEKGRHAIELAQQNMIPLMTIGLIGIVLCFVGALWMRRLKKEGYWLYVAGEIAPVIAGIAILGTSQFDGIVSILVNFGIPVLFVILYTLQRKYLVR